MTVTLNWNVNGSTEETDNTQANIYSSLYNTYLTDTMTVSIMWWLIVLLCFIALWLQFSMQRNSAL